MYTILAFGIILSKLQRLQTVNFSVGKFKTVSWEKIGVLPPQSICLRHRPDASNQLNITLSYCSHLNVITKFNSGVTTFFRVIFLLFALTESHSN